MSTRRPNTPPRGLVESVFFAILERTEAERDLFLSECCEGDSELELAVRALLAAHQRTGGFDRLGGDFAAMRQQVFGPLHAGAVVGPYEIIDLVGAGGMGQVYRARDPRLDREVAVKVLLQANASDPDQVERFEREARAAAALSDPAILAVFDVGSHEGVPYLVSELLDGESLRHRLQAGQFTPSQVRDLALQLAKGIGVAHDAGIVHRDLKPENLFLTRDGRLKILDFGLAKLFGGGFSDARAESSHSLTEPGSILGTVGYMSPEQVRGERVDVRSDLFAVGAVLHEAFTGVAPFRRTSKAETLAAILHERPSTGGDELPPALRWIVLRCLEKDPEKRFQSAGDLLAALQGQPDKSTVSQSPRRDASSDDPSPSIAVLPFADMSPERNQQYFCEGVADELITALTGIEGLRVAARSSSFQFRDTGVDLSAIRDRLRVASVLEGSIRKSGNQLRVTVQLIDVADGYHRWSARYDRPLDDVFAIQDEIARSVVDALPGVLAAGGIPRQHVRTNVAAYESYLRGRSLLTHWDQSSQMQGARRYLEEALALDSNYAPALAALARLEAEVFRNFEPDMQHLDQAEKLATRALAVSPDLAEAHVAIGKLLGSRDQYEAAAAACRRAAELAPGDPVPWDELSWALGYQVPPAAEEAEEAARKAIDIAPLMLGPHYHLGRALLLQGRLEAATEAFEHARELDPNFDAPLFGLALVHLERGDSDLALATLRENIACANAPQVRVAFALIHAVRGETDEALQVLETVVGSGAYSDLGYLEATPHLDSLRSEPRFRQLLDELR